MKVAVLDAPFASAFLFWFNMKIINLTTYAVFGYLERQGTEEEEYEDEDLPAVCSECREFKPPPVQVIDDVGKKCH